MRFSRPAAAIGLVAALSLAGCAAAAPAVATNTPAAAAPDGLPPPVVETLPNGLTLITQVHRTADIEAVYLWVATGVRYETPDGLGYAHFQEHMLFKGTKSFGPGHIDRAVEGIGG